MFGRRSSQNSQQTGGSGGGGGDSTNGSVIRANLGYENDSKSSSSSEFPDDASDRESLQSWAKEAQEKEKEDDVDLFAKKEGKRLRLRFMAITIGLVLVGVGLCVFTYFYLTGQEQDAFESTFYNTAQSILGSSNFHMQVIARALEGRSQALTSFAAFTGSLWPFVSIPDFELQGGNFLLETGTEMIAWAPLVIGGDTLIAWEAYSGYMLDSSGWFPTIASEEPLKSEVDLLEEQNMQQNETKSNNGLYVPLWQISPWFYNQWIKHNLTEQFEEPIERLLQTKQSVWSRFLEMTERPDSSEYITNQSTVSPSGSESESDTASISSLLFQPVFRSLATHDVTYGTIKNFTAAQEEVVGIYISAIQWDKFLMSQIPEGTPDVVILIKNTWGETLTYQLSSSEENGATATFISTGDEHTQHRTEISQSAFLTTTPEPEDILVTQSTSSVDQLDREGELRSARGTEPGGFEVTLYPTESFEEVYNSLEPLRLTIILAAIVFCAIITFFWYSRTVHNRQQKLAETANRAALVVKSLFPSNVRDRIMQEAEESDLKVKAKKKQAKYKEGDGSTSGVDRERGGGGSILGNISVGSVGSRYARRLSMTGNSRRGSASRASTKGSADQSQRNNSMSSDNPYGSKPIADHFSETTVLFADIVGFTAWSSIREPVAVFSLLETIYHAFDKVARKRGIFKVETIGDCYVAVCGLPVPRVDHAIAMSYFATDCIRKMANLTKKLEVTLGPDTAALRMRIGLHSGPVTAGVLRGEKSRFQLFGDTVNTAARMESNGKPDFIHVSEATAKLLTDAGKSKWLTQREDKIVAKGKGEMQTFWVQVRSMIPLASGTMANRSTVDSGITDDDDASSLGEMSVDFTPNWEQDVTPENLVLGDRLQRLVNWNVDQLIKLLKRVVSNREGQEAEDMIDAADFDLRTDTSILQEVTEIITFPKPGASAGDVKGDCEHLSLDTKVVAQLHEYMTMIAKSYNNDNAYSNFAHSSHTAMAITTWLSHVIPAPPPEKSSKDIYELELNLSGETNSSLSKSLFALRSDPLTHFALVYSSLIKDLDHTGVPNAQLVKEKSQVATLYNNISIHEQESVDSAFELLMDDKYSDLRRTIFATENEFYRFRQIVINCVLATDMSNEKVMGKQAVRWGCLFRGTENAQSDDISLDYEPENEGDQKVSVVIERLSLVSDFAHYMQHWYVYRKWNEKLFEEKYLAWKAGRADFDPSISWYESEIDFFDTYAIPLAAKMKDCELFDASCGESLNYAKSNREHWINTGKEEVASMMEKLVDIEYEVQDTFDPVSDGKVYSPSNGRRIVKPRTKDWQSSMDVSKASFDTVFSTDRTNR